MSGHCQLPNLCSCSTSSFSALSHILRAAHVRIFNLFMFMSQIDINLESIQTKTKKNRGVRVRFVEHTSNQIYSKSPKITRLCPVQIFLRRENVIKSLRKSRWNFLQNSDIMKLFYLNRSVGVFSVHLYDCLAGPIDVSLQIYAI